LLGALFPLIVFAFGAAIGSFLNVVIYRLPAALSLLHPPSRCPTCHHPLRPYDNVPVLGWLWLKGRCRYCRSPISPRYPLIEALTGGLFLGTFGYFGLTTATVAAWILVSWLICLSFIDLDTLTLPNALTQSGLVLGILAQTFLVFSADAVTLPGAARGLMTAIVGAVLGIWIFETHRLCGLTGRRGKR
jgi:leader peptidase (prepilin peptidase)/N-methyltransferase